MRSSRRLAMRATCPWPSPRSAVPPFARSRRSTSATCMKEWVNELIEAVKSGDSEYFRAPETNTGDGSGLLGGAARCSLSQRVGQGRQDPGLSDHHPVHVEPGSEEREGASTVRSRRL